MTDLRRCDNCDSSVCLDISAFSLGQRVADQYITVECPEGKKHFCSRKCLADYYNENK